MADSTAQRVTAAWPGGIGFGVWWFIWGVYGFWWGVLYGSFWPIWIGFRLAQFLTGHY